VGSKVLMIYKTRGEDEDLFLKLAKRRGFEVEIVSEMIRLVILYVNFSMIRFQGISLMWSSEKIWSMFCL
jgi:hypothetical protein